MATARVRIPPLSVDAAQFVRSIIGSTTDTIDVSELTESQIDELLVVLEAEYETAAMPPDRMQAVSEFAAFLTRAQGAGSGRAAD